jgi:hypothetical protein
MVKKLLGAQQHFAAYVGKRAIGRKKYGMKYNY